MKESATEKTAKRLWKEVFETRNFSEKRGISITILEKEKETASSIIKVYELPISELSSVNEENQRKDTLK